MGIKLSHVKKRMAIITGKNQHKNELLISRNTKDGKSVSILMNTYPTKWVVFDTEELLMALAYVTMTDEQIREQLDDEDRT